MISIYIFNKLKKSIKVKYLNLNYFINNSKANSALIPVVLSGGKGSRLWPLSRECLPKQYLNLNDDNCHTLIQNTFLRLEGIKNLEKPIIISNEEQRFLVAEQIRELDIEPETILLEPFGRNTAPAIALAAILANKNQTEDPLLLVLSSDHKISNAKKFQEKIADGINLANQGQLVTFGIVPNKPETGYGYIEAKTIISNENLSSKINRFIEKPKKELAEELIKDKRYLWNSGIFLFKASSILDELKNFEPKIVDLCEKALIDQDKDFDFQRVNKSIFEKCPNISIDNAVMEKTNLGSVLALDAGWSDIGDWKSVWENSKKDINGNSLRGKTLLKNSKDCYLRSENRLVVGLDIENLIIIETSDAILVANKNSSQSVKEIVSELEDNSFSEGKISKKMHRPWGSYTSVVEGKNWQVKKLEINPKASLSLQMHHYRSEHWVVVDGTAEVEINDQISILSENESVYIPLGSKHRLSNPGKLPLTLIEVQSGTYIGEDDIIRFNDIYGRKTY